MKPVARLLTLVIVVILDSSSIKAGSRKVRKEAAKTAKRESLVGHLL